MINKKTVILMKLNTHDRTPRPENSKLIKGLFVLCGVLMYSIFGLGSFACFYYAKSIVGGIFIILIPVLVTALILTHIKDMERAYVEINENEIHIVDYYWGIKKEKHISHLIESPKKLQEELKKCIVVCSNCHRDLHYKKINLK